MTDKVAVEKAVAVVMQESGRRALFDATQRLGANYREKAGLINSVDGVNLSRNCLQGNKVVIIIMWAFGQITLFSLLLPTIIDLPKLTA